jgi:iron complex transport system substrate-binding protein
VTTLPRVAMINRPGGGDIRVFGTADVATTIIEAAGGVQAFDDIDGRMKRIGTEELIARSPDIILVPACCGVDVGPEGAEPVIAALRADPALANVPAVRENRIHAITFAEISPGVRNAEAVANIARLLHAERF